MLSEPDFLSESFASPMIPLDNISRSLFIHQTAKIFLSVIHCLHSTIISDAPSFISLCTGYSWSFMVLKASVISLHHIYRNSRLSTFARISFFTDHLWCVQMLLHYRSRIVSGVRRTSSPSAVLLYSFWKIKLHLIGLFHEIPKASVPSIFLVAEEVTESYSVCMWLHLQFF